MDPFPNIDGILANVIHIITSGTDPNKKYENAQTTLLHYAAGNCYLDIVKYLVESGADVNQTDNFGCTPLIIVFHNSMCAGSAKVIRYLLTHGADPNLYENHGSSILHTSTYFNDLTMIKSLVEYSTIGININIDIVDDSNRTPLMVAALKGYGHIVKYLLDHGADAGLCDLTGHTAATLARSRCFYTLADLIESREPVPTKGVYE